MDNQYYPQGGQPWTQGEQPGAGYQQPVQQPNPYANPGYPPQQPPADPYAVPVQGVDPYGNPVYYPPQQPGAYQTQAQLMTDAYGNPIQGVDAYGNPIYPQQNAPYVQQPYGDVPQQPGQTPQGNTGFYSPYGGLVQPDQVQQTQQMQQMNQAVPPKPRKLTFLYITVAVVVVAFLGWMFWGNIAPQAAATGVITNGSLSAYHAGECLIVRNEVPFDAEGVTTVIYQAKEGSAITLDTEICKVYSSGTSVRELNNLRSYRADIRNYQRDLIIADRNKDETLENVSTAVEASVREVRSLINGARGSLTNQETILTKAVKDRQTYVKTKYASDQRLARYNDDESSQQQRIDSWTTQKTATMNAVVSFYSDGYEYAITGENWTSFTPREVRSMVNGSLPKNDNSRLGKTTIYRMIRDGEWYVLFLSDNTEWNPVVGSRYTLQLQQFDATNVTAEVVSFTKAGGELLVRLRVNSSVEPMLYMRACQATLGENLTPLCASERAITTQDGMTGVVVIDGGMESFIPVSIIYKENGNVYFQGVQQGLLYAGLTVKLH